MRRVSVVGVCVLALCALNAVVGTGASAALPEWGRCKAGAGVFNNAGCTVGGAAYKWFTTIANKNFTLVSSGGMTLTTPGYITIECASGTGSGKFKAAASITEVHKVRLVWTGCIVPGYAGSTCENAGPGEIVTNYLKGPVGFINNAPIEVGQELVAEQKNHPWAAFTCHWAFTSSVVLGKPEKKPHFNAAILTFNPFTQYDNMASVFEVRFSQAGGSQIPQDFVPATGPYNLEISFLGTTGPWEKTGLSEALDLKAAEPVEVKAEP